VRADFGAGGLLAHLDGPGIAVTVLPADVLAQPIDFTEDVRDTVLPDRFEGLTANGVSQLSHVTTTSTALIRYSPSQEQDRWAAFVALDRSGGVQAAIGIVSRYQLNQGRNAPANVLYLFMLVHLARVVVHTQGRVYDWTGSHAASVTADGPFEIIVAAAGTAGMMLDGCNQGWDPLEYAFNPPRALEKNVMVRLQVESWPKEQDDLEALAMRVIDRACQAFGDDQQRYLSRGGTEAGTMSRRYA
jgi:hypothetical protein